MSIEEIENLKTLLQSPKKIGITTHFNPDGDAIGSSLGLFHYLKKTHDVHVIVPNPYPHFLKWMPGNEKVQIFSEKEDFCEQLIQNCDLIFNLDYNILSRTGKMAAIIKESPGTKVLIDHHPQPDSFATFAYSDPSMSSTAEMIYHFIDMLGDSHKIDSDSAQCLYTGIVTDTGSFRFPATSNKTHLVASQLINKGINNAEIHQLLFNQNSFDRIQLLGCAIQKMVYLKDYNTAYLYLTENDLNKFNFTKGDTEGFVNYALSIKGVVLAVLFIESKKEGYIKMSLRSKGNFSVNKMAREHFSGGGHRNAAGGRSDMSLTECIQNFKNILHTYKQELQNA